MLHRLLCAIFATLVAAGSSAAATAELQCSYDRSAQTFGIWLDFDRGLLFMGDQHIQQVFGISKTTPNFLTALGSGKITTAFDDPNPNLTHGGSVIVINRQSGKLYASSIGLQCEVAGDCKQSSVNTYINTGKCTTRVF